MKLYAFKSHLTLPFDGIPLYSESVAAKIPEQELIVEVTEERLNELHDKGKKFYLKFRLETKESCDNLRSRVQDFKQH